MTELREKALRKIEEGLAELHQSAMEAIDGGGNVVLDDWMLVSTARFFEGDRLRTQIMFLEREDIPRYRVLGLLEELNIHHDPNGCTCPED